MLTRFQVVRLAAERARVLKAEALTPLHAASEAMHDAGGDDEAERRRRRVQHEADPYPVEAPEVAVADLDKAFRQASDVATGYPPMAPPLSADMFRRGPVTSGEASYGADYDVPGWSVRVPRGTLEASTISRALISEGQSRACTPGGC
jgi:hypothetical protein